jgi:hypothetical protein
LIGLIVDKSALKPDVRFALSQTLTAIFSEPYWERVWIMQEMACAAYLLVWYAEMSFEADGLDLFQTGPLDIAREVPLIDSKTVMDNQERLLCLRIKFSRRKTLTNIVFLAQTGAVTVQRDRIYGLLGLLP